MLLKKDEFPDLVTRENDCVIVSFDEPLRTKDGNEYAHRNERLLKHVLTDLLLKDEKDNRLSPSTILEYEIDCLNKKNDFILENFNDLAHPDPFYLLKSGKITGKTIRETDTDYNELSIHLTFWTVSSILRILNDFITQNLHLAEIAEETEEPVLLLMKQLYLQAPEGKKAAVYALWTNHYPGLVLPFMLVSGLITPAEYAKGVIALRLSKQLPALPGEHVMKNFSEIPGERSGSFEDIYHDAVVVKDYISIIEKKTSADQKLEEWIREGESSKVEFKSTFRWDLKAGKTNPSVERASLKTICGFLNSSGGTLLIGIRDDGSVEGIESDKFANEDKFLLHLWTLIRTCLGRDVSPYVSTFIEKKDERSVCIVRCTPSTRPVFLRQPGFDEEFYIRLGPGSAALDISEALKYIADRFGSDYLSGES